MKDIKQKEKIIQGARIANAVPETQQFWREVKQRMDIREKSLVTKRKTRD
jgi:hypothetical protein